MPFLENGSVRSSSIGRNTSYHCKNLKVTKIRFLLIEISLLWSNRGRNLIILFSFIQITEDMLARTLQAVERSKANWNWLWNIDVELYRWWFVTLEICRFHLDLETSLIGMLCIHWAMYSAGNLVVLQKCSSGGQTQIFLRQPIHIPRSLQSLGLVFMKFMSPFHLTLKSIWGRNSFPALYIYSISKTFFCSFFSLFCVTATLKSIYDRTHKRKPKERLGWSGKTVTLRLWKR